MTDTENAFILEKLFGYKVEKTSYGFQYHHPEEPDEGYTSSSVPLYFDAIWQNKILELLSKKNQFSLHCDDVNNFTFTIRNLGISCRGATIGDAILATVLEMLNYR